MKLFRKRHYFGGGTLDTGQAVQWDGDLAVGTVIMVVTDTGETLPLPSGNYVITTENGEQFSVTVDDTGTVTALSPTGQTAPTAAQSVMSRRRFRAFASATTADGVTLQWDGELAVGTAVNEVLEDGTTQPANGEYALTLPDGTQVTVVCENGVVTAINPSAAAVTARQMQWIARKFAEIERKIQLLSVQFQAFQNAWKHSDGEGSDLMKISRTYRRT